MSVTDVLSDYIVGASTRDLPDSVVEKAKLHVIDTLAAVVSGRFLDAGRAGARMADAFGTGNEATVVAAAARASMPVAALANGMAAHADETDDSHELSRTHPGSCVVPAALAVGEERGLSGMEFIRAVVVGYDISCRIPPAIWPDLNELNSQAVSTHAIGGVFGAGAAAVCAAKGSRDEVVATISYCSHLAAGQETWVRDTGHVQKAYIFAGMPAMNGTLAWLFARSGWRGVEDVFAGSPNFLHAMGSSPTPEALVEGLGSRYEVMRTNIKLFPVGSSSQAPLVALFRLLREVEGPEQVVEVVAEISPSLARTVVGRSIPNINIAYLMSVALDDGELTSRAAHDAQRFAIWSSRGGDPRVKIVADESLGTGRGARVSLRTRGDSTYEMSVTDAPGTAGNPMSREEIERKAANLMCPVLGDLRTNALIKQIAELEKAESLVPIAELLAQPSDSLDGE